MSNSSENILISTSIELYLNDVRVLQLMAFISGQSLDQRSQDIFKILQNLAAVAEIQ